MTTIRTAIITGANSGMGEAIARNLSHQGYHLLLIARNETRLKKISDEIKATYLATNVADYVSLQQGVHNFINKHKHIDLLVNSAGYVKRGTSDLAPNEFQQMIAANLIGTFNTVHLVTPFMKQQRSGRIINISSISGITARKFLGGYAATKFGVNGYNEALYKELADYDIPVTSICPNLVRTEMTKDVTSISHDSMIPTADIVKTVNFLLDLSPQTLIEKIVLECKAAVTTEII